MEIRELERAIRSAMKSPSYGSTQLALAGVSDIGLKLPQEFAEAAQTLSARTEMKSDGESILLKAFRWA